jgi:homopolymeric O-antigen transport system ATP-binding protein
MDSLRQLCTRGLWLRQGQLVGDGPIDAVIDEYLAWTHAATR